MIVTNGSPETYGSYTVMELSWNDCLTYCTTNSTCMVVYNNGSDTTCQIFNIGQLETVKRRYSCKFEVAFKTKDNASKICPADDTIGGQSYILGKNEKRRDAYSAYSFKYNPTTEVWVFNSTLTECPTAGYILSLRAGGPWCTMLIPGSLKQFINWEQAADLCSTKYNSQLSGLETQEEFDWIAYLASFGNGWNRSSTMSMALYAAWMDGVRKPECIGNSACKGLSAFQFSDPTLSSNPKGFIWNPNQPNGTTKDCLAFRTNSDGTFGIDDVLCSMTSSADNRTRFQAYICGGLPNLL